MNVSKGDWAPFLYRTHHLETFDNFFENIFFQEKESSNLILNISKFQKSRINIQNAIFSYNTHWCNQIENSRTRRKLVFHKRTSPFAKWIWQPIIILN